MYFLRVVKRVKVTITSVFMFYNLQKHLHIILFSLHNTENRFYNPHFTGDKTKFQED